VLPSQSKGILLSSPYLELGDPPSPRLDLGKKVSTPQDVMIEELSLRTNRGSQLFQQRQKRMQRFIFEYPSGYRKVGLLVAPDTPALSRMAFPQLSHPGSHCHSLAATAAAKALSPPNAGYSGPLKEVPPEKFNITAIPKGYHSPWQEFLSEKDYLADSENQLPMKPTHGDFRSFNRTPIPFDRAQISDTFSMPAMEFDNLSTLELISHRRNFNRAPQGWVRILPESDEL
uniref:Myozenin 3 n=1 Tax=Apteryx owenii TaxID=8824 RepID=A0A8B9SCV0_APTOW